MALVAIIGLALLGGALLAVAGAALWAWTNHRRFNSWRRAEGRVLRLAERGPPTRFAPVIVFEGPSGPVEFESLVASAPPSHQPGARVPVLFDPRQPQSAMIDGVLERWLGPMVVGSLGTVAGLVGALLVALS